MDSNNEGLWSVSSGTKIVLMEEGLRLFVSKKKEGLWSHSSRVSLASKPRLSAFVV